MKEYIDREAAISLSKDIIVPQASGVDYKHRCIDPQDIREIPAADVVPVVRCRECKYHNKPRLGFCERHLVRTNGNDFCSYGERKGE